MNEVDLRDLLAAVRDLMRPHLERSEPLRRVVEHVGTLLIEESVRARGEAVHERPVTSADGAIGEQEREGLGDSGESSLREGAPLQEAEATEETEEAVPEIVVEADLPLMFGGTSTNVAVQGTADEIARARAAAELDHKPESGTSAFRAPAIDRSEIDLALIERRCKIKAASCRLFIRRRSAAGDPLLEPPLLEEMNAMIAEAKGMQGCFLWAFWRDGPQPDDGGLNTIARCYEVLGHVAAVATTMNGLGERARARDVQGFFEIGAEAVSALRIALEQTWLTSADTDQAEFYKWIRGETLDRKVYVPRFMTLEDAADPSAIEDLARRLGDLEERVGGHADRLKRIKEAFNRIKYHCGLFHALRDDESNGHDRLKIAESIELLADLGVPFSDLRFREHVDECIAESILSTVDCSPTVQRVLESVREAHAAAQTKAPGNTRENEGWSERVLEVRALLAGGDVVMIGGEPRNDAIARMTDAFALGELVWVRLTEHGSGQAMANPIQRPSTRLVLVLVKLAGHLHADKARKVAKEAGKPLVMLKAGYNPEQVAEAVVQQVSDRFQPSEVASNA